MGTPKPLEVGDHAPMFAFREVEGNGAIDRHLGDGESFYLLFFYPKDATPGCTKEVCAFRDSWQRLRALGVEIVGVSGDTELSHERFTKKHDLPFPLIADTDLSLCKSYGVYGEKKFMGKIYNGIHRMSFLIGADQKIIKTYTKVKPETHPEQVITDINERTQ